jgi:hypothetical protein
LFDFGDNLPAIILGAKVGDIAPAKTVTVGFRLAEKYRLNPAIQNFVGLVAESHFPLRGVCSAFNL